MSEPANSLAYTPTSRRPIADAFRATANWAVRLCIRFNIHPDAVSCSSIVASGMAGACFLLAGKYPWLLIPGPLLCYLRLWLNMLDGMVAMASGKASWRGEILNDLPDRISDVLIFAGVAHGGLCAVPSGYWAAIAALLTAYVGMFGQAVGAKRQFGGMMSKPWRMVLLHIGSWLALGMLTLDRSIVVMQSLTVIDFTCILIIAGCIQTIGVRLRRIFAALAKP